MSDRARVAKPRRARGQVFLATVVLIGVVVGAIALDRVGPKTPPEATPVAGAPTSARSGVWFCPHGGGDGSETKLEIANPTQSPVTVRVSHVDENGPAGETSTFDVAPMTVKAVDAPSTTTGSGSMVEYFGGFVGAGWVESAKAGGVAAEPCTPDAGTHFLLPDGTAAKGEDAYAILMNPFGQEAVYTARIFTPGQAPVETPEQVVRPHHAVAVHLNEFGVIGQATVGAEIDVSLGRLSAASLGVTKGGGLRSSLGEMQAPLQGTVLPGGLDSGVANLEVTNTTQDKAVLSSRSFTGGGDRTTAGAQGESVQAESALSVRPKTKSPTGIFVSAPGVPLGVARRTAGTDGDEGSTVGVPFGTGGGSWVVLPAVIGKPPFDPRLYITNQDEEAAEVTVTLLPEEGDKPDKLQQTLTVKTRSSAYVDLPHANPTAAVLVTSPAKVVPIFTSYSNDRTGYAVSVGVPVTP